MTAGMAVDVRSVRRTALLASFAVLVLAALAAPRSLHGADDPGSGTQWRKCVDQAFADYNECLMESSRWLDRKVCDFAFELDVVVCSAKVGGDIKDAWNGNA